MNIPPISMIVFTLMVLFSVFGFKMKNKKNPFVGFFIVYVAFLIFVFILDILNISLNDIILLLVVMTIFTHFYFGESLRFYYTMKYFDRMLHLFGTIAFTLFIYSIIIKIIKPTIDNNVFLFIFILSLGALIGVICELIEFAIDRVCKTKEQNGLKDTDFDLIFDLIGSVITCILVIYNHSWFW